MKRPSRKRFQEALKALKGAAKNEHLPWVLRVRACELLMCIYGVPLPESSVRAKRAVRELVEEGQFERDLREQLRQKDQQDAITAAREFLARAENGEQ